MKQNIIYIFFIILFSISSCDFENKTDKNISKSKDYSLDLIIISDLHYFAKELGVGEPAFYRDKLTESKLSELSEDIIKLLFQEIEISPIKNILICGDLTHHGEKYNHLKITKMLKELKGKGKNIYVIPGNHDINNYTASKFKGLDYYLIDFVSPREFEEIYNEFSFYNAFAKDSFSLSYATELDHYYDIICLDAARYSEYTKSSMPSSGKLNNNTLTWLDEVLKERIKLNKKFIVMLHFNLIEHFQGQASNPISNSYILKNSSELINILNKYNIQLVFTGHFHANDIVKQGDIYDIQTGSAITYPHSYRIVHINNSIAKIETININGANLKIENKTLQDYSKIKISRGLNNFFEYHWKKIGKNYSPELKNKLKENFIKIVFAHYYGDEKIDNETKIFCDELINSNDKLLKLIGYALKTVYKDPEPSDRNISIKLLKK